MSILTAHLSQDATRIARTAIWLRPHVPSTETDVLWRKTGVVPPILTQFVAVFS
jgi:hypothetical protein